MAGAAHQLHFLGQLVVFIAKPSAGFGAGQAFDDVEIVYSIANAGFIAEDAIGQKVIKAAKVATAADWPSNWRTFDLQNVFDFVQEFDGIADFPVQLVHERHGWGVAQTAYLQQFDGARFHALGAVDNHQRRIHRRQRPVGIFGEVLVTGRVKQVHDAVVIVELHDRRRHGNASLAFHRHPIGGGVAFGFARLDGAGELDGIAEQQELLGNRCFAGVRVGDDGEGTPAFHLATVCR